MGLPLLALVKLKILASTSHTLSFNPLITCLVGPFVLKVLLNLRTLPSIYDDVSHASRLFFFQVNQIVFHIRQDDLGDRSRWQRAIRVFSEMITNSRRSTESDEARSLHDLSMITL
ncbi:Zinc finger protein [Heracleum sosnowskyi]|uniref:Zinc finger protein n=1 Tax=Heracleum sosnowskyi TaxID=360622 RepID=A0AAD8IAD0_9APIA|nr:Zinc finger protein [Heracleum sosnowskyi]